MVCDPALLRQLPGMVGAFSAKNGPESHRAADPTGPYPAFIFAYIASKIWAFNATEKWMAERKPSFEVVNIQPTFVIGRDDTVVDAAGTIKGTNAMIMGPLLGHAAENPNPGATVHIDDVAKLHVRSLKPDIPGNKNYVATCNPPSGIEFADSFSIAKNKFPKECAEGIFKVDTTPKPQTVPVKIDSSLSEKTFGLVFKSFEEQVVSVAGHYIELLRK
jgi:nucleoside-diphosphate-sugar epimerase